MKKLLITFTFVLIAILACNNQANATNVTVHLTITDNLNTLGCPSSYSGYYHVTITIIGDGQTRCVYQRYDISQGGSD